MNKQDLYQLLRDPHLIESSHISALEALITSYPYCASFVFLYLYGLAKTEDVRYSAELKRYVAYLPNRSALFEMLSSLEIPERKEKKKPTGDTFDLIDSFLEDARSSGEDLPTELRFDQQERSEYFSEAVAKPIESMEELGSELSRNHNSTRSDPDTSSNGNEELFTETLAKIYIQQGKYERALGIISSLHLHYPQKNRYFAEQIRYLKRLTTNSNQV